MAKETQFDGLNRAFTALGMPAYLGRPPTQPQSVKQVRRLMREMGQQIVRAAEARRGRAT